MRCLASPERTPEDNPHQEKIVLFAQHIINSQPSTHSYHLPYGSCYLLHDTAMRTLCITVDFFFLVAICRPALGLPSTCGGFVTSSSSQSETLTTRRTSGDKLSDRTNTYAWQRLPKSPGIDCSFSTAHMLHGTRLCRSMHTTSSQALYFTATARHQSLRGWIVGCPPSVPCSAL